MMKRAANFICVMAIALATVLINPNAARADGRGVVTLFSAGFWCSCIYIQFGSATYQLFYNTPNFGDVKQVLYTSAINGVPVNYYLSGSSIVQAELGNWQ